MWFWEDSAQRSAIFFKNPQSLREWKFKLFVFVLGLQYIYVIVLNWGFFFQKVLFVNTNYCL